MILRSEKDGLIKIHCFIASKSIIAWKEGVGKWVLVYFEAVFWHLDRRSKVQ
jgi:hypothetical protein